MTGSGSHGKEFGLRAVCGGGRTAWDLGNMKGMDYERINAFRGGINLCGVCGLQCAASVLRAIVAAGSCTRPCPGRYESGARCSGEDGTRDGA